MILPAIPGARPLRASLVSCGENRYPALDQDMWFPFDVLASRFVRAQAARAMFRLMLELLAGLDGEIAGLDKEISQRAREGEISRRLMTVPGIGPISATAIAALAPLVETFAKGRDFAAWLGLSPLQRSTGGKQKLGRTSKMGERTLRRPLIIGSSAVVQ